MGEIKSALELALERTRDVKSDPESWRRHEAEQDGKRLYARLRNGEEIDLPAELKAVPADRRAWVRQGLFDVALTNLNLPQSEADLAMVDVSEQALSHLVRDTAMLRELMGQVRQFFRQYLDDRTQLTDQLKQQFEPRMRQREQQYQQQYGRAVKLDPMQDPEFVQVLQDHLGRLDGQYRGALQEVHGHLRNMFAT